MAPSKMSTRDHVINVLSDKDNINRSKKAVSYQKLYSALGEEMGTHEVEKEHKERGVEMLKVLGPQQKTHVKHTIHEMIKEGEIEYPLEDNKHWVRVSPDASPATSPVKKKASPKKKGKTPTKSAAKKPKAKTPPKKKTTPKKGSKATTAAETTETESASDMSDEECE